MSRCWVDPCRKGVLRLDREVYARNGTLWPPREAPESPATGVETPAGFGWSPGIGSSTSGGRRLSDAADQTERQWSPTWRACQGRHRPDAVEGFARRLVSHLMPPTRAEPRLPLTRRGPVRHGDPGHRALPSHAPLAPGSPRGRAASSEARGPCQGPGECDSSTCLPGWR